MSELSFEKFDLPIPDSIKEYSQEKQELYKCESDYYQLNRFYQNNIKF
jgi:hypothetical protein